MSNVDFFIFTQQSREDEKMLLTSFDNADNSWCISAPLMNDTDTLLAATAHCRLTVDQDANYAAYGIVALCVAVIGLAVCAFTRGRQDVHPI